MLAVLDKLEGVPEHYLRETEKVVTNDGTSFDCFIYLKTEFDSKLLKEQHLEHYSLQMHAKYIPPPMRAKTEANCKTVESLLRTHSFEKHYLNSEDIQLSTFSQMEYYEEFKSRVSRLCNADGKTQFLEVGCENAGPVARNLFLQQDSKNNDDENRNHEVHSLTNVLDLGQRYQIQHFHAISCINMLDFVTERLHWHVIRSLVAALKPNQGTGEPSVLFISWNDEHQFVEKYFEDASDLHFPPSKGRFSMQNKQILFIV
mmetsp:Transcript_4898/g.5732  ORF Transcript_4898/g.5732 Transcript_4898/m.5732 type:complete len:259 (+) Transcript_4898:719-1495(+)